MKKCCFSIFFKKCEIKYLSVSWTEHHPEFLKNYDRHFLPFTDACLIIKKQLFVGIATRLTKLKIAIS